MSAQVPEQVTNVSDYRLAKVEEAVLGVDKKLDTVLQKLENTTSDVTLLKYKVAQLEAWKKWLVTSISGLAITVIADLFHQFITK